MKDDDAAPSDRSFEGSASTQGPTEQQGAARIARRPATRFELSPSRDRTLLQAVAGAAPGIGVLRRYRRSWLRSDVYAGISVVAYMVPQVMAYTALVGVPPVAGLWTALAALIVYAALGSSRVLSVGPESTIALMAGTAIAPLAGGDPDRAVALAAALSLIVGGWCLVGRLARLGVISDLLSQPLLVGYLAGAAVLMVVGQLGKMTGTTVEGDNLVAQLRSFAAVVDDTDLLTLAVGAGTLGVLLVVHVLRPRWPATLIAVAAATVVCVAADLADHGVAVVGAVPTGLPTPGLPDVTWEEFRTLVLAGLGIAVIGYSDCMLIARAFPAPAEEGEPARESVDPQQELTALAGVQAAAGLMSGFPVSSSGSRTALAIAARARSQLYSLVAAAVVVLVLFVAGPLIENLPQASLAAVVFYAASTLVSWQEVVRLARFRTTELLLAVTATLGNGPASASSSASAWRSRSAWSRSSCGWLAPTKACSAACRGWPGCTTSTTTPTPRPCRASSSTATTPRCSSPTSPTCAGAPCSPWTRRTPPAPSTPCDGSSSTSKPTSKSTSPPPTACATSTATSPPEVSASPWRGSRPTCGYRWNGPGWPT